MNSSSPEQTKQIAANFAKTLKGGEVIFLYGDMGSGKTTFVQGFMAELGFLEPVRSPTFALMHTYPVDYGLIKRVVHLDLYRLNDRKELRAFGLEEVLNDPATIVLVEWPEKGFPEGWLPTHNIHFKIGINNFRCIEIV